MTIKSNIYFIKIRRHIITNRHVWLRFVSPLLVFILINFFLIKPIYEKIDENAFLTHNAKIKLEESRSSLLLEKRWLREIDKAEKILKTKGESANKIKNGNEFVEKVLLHASNAQVNILELEAEPLQKGNKLDELSLRLKIGGSFSKIVTLLNEFETNNPPFSIEALNMEKESNGSLVSRLRIKVFTTQ